MDHPGGLTMVQSGIIDENHMLLMCGGADMPKNYAPQGKCWYLNFVVAVEIEWLTIKGLSI